MGFTFAQHGFLPLPLIIDLLQPREIPHSRVVILVQLWIFDVVWHVGNWRDYQIRCNARAAIVTETRM